MDNKKVYEGQEHESSYPGMAHIYGSSQGSSSL